MHKYKMETEDVMFTADHHFGHTNIIKYVNRPFDDAYHMDIEMIQRWNMVVRPEQTVFHLGDFCFKGRKNAKHYLDQLNGNVILIQGNHDHRRDLKYFDAVHDLAEVMIGDQRIVMCHYSMLVWNHSFRGSWHIHGHSHGTLTPRMDRKVLDVGVDDWMFAPISYPQLRGAMSLHDQEEWELAEQIKAAARNTKEIL